jgi:hypothetical protein
MENEKSPKQTLKELIESDYTSYLLNLKLEEALKKKWSKFQFIVYLIIAGFGYLGFDIFQRAGEIREIKSEFQSQLRKINFEREKIAVLTDSIRNAMKDQKVEIQTNQNAVEFGRYAAEQSSHFSALYYDLFKDQLSQTKTLRDSLSVGNIRYKEFAKTIDNKIRSYQLQYRELEQTRESLVERITKIDKYAKETALNSSLKYIYAEKSNRKPNPTILNRAYKPSIYVLPGKDTLEIVFSEVVTKNRTTKEVLINVYKNRVDLHNGPIRFSEQNGRLSPDRVPLQLREHTCYIEPVFIYLPPNVPGTLIIPDFIVLKVSLEEKVHIGMNTN